MKQAFLSTVRQRIEELFPDSSTLSMESLRREIGTPEEIASGLESRPDIEQLKEMAKRYKRVKILCIIFFVLAVLCISAFIAIVILNQGYAMKIFVK